MLFFKSEKWAVDVPRDLGNRLCGLFDAVGIRYQDLNPQGEFSTIVIHLPKDKVLKIGKAFNIRPYKRR